MTTALLHFDPANYLRLDEPNAIGTSGSGASFATSTGDVLEVGCYGPGLFRLRIGPHTRPDYGILVGRAKPCTVGQPKRGEWTFDAGEARLAIAGSPLRFELSWKGSPVLSSVTDLDLRGVPRLPTFGRIRQGGEWTAALALASGEAVYGFGEKFGPLDKRGQLVHSHVEDALGVNTGRSSRNVPFAWSPGTGRGAWGVFVHTPGRVAHGVGFADWSHRSYAMVVDDEALDLFVFAAGAPSDILELFTQLTGRPAEVPLWSLGLWTVAPSTRTDDAIAVAEKLRERRIPCDVLTIDRQGTWNAETGFDFRWAGIENPRATLGAIREHHLRIGVCEQPLVPVHAPLFSDLASRDYLLKDAAGDPYVLRADPAAFRRRDDTVAHPDSGIVDFTNPAAYVWWRDAHKALFEDGVDVIETLSGEHVPADAIAHNGDSGRRLHNAYPLLYGRCVFEATDKFQRRESAPPIVASPAGWAGQQRYPTGCVDGAQRDWEGLAASIRGGLACGMSGNPFHGSAIGGASGEDAPSPELCLRWLQAMVFSAHMRLPLAGREPWALGAEVEAIARKWLSFRYRLIPYLAASLAQSSRTGMPLMRAMPLAFPRNALVASFETQFLCGDALLVAPIVAPGGEVEVALPPGAWYDLNTRRRYAGRQVLRYRAPLDQFPAFGREGHALPLGRAVQHTGAIDPEQPLEMLWVFGPPTAPLEGFAQAGVEIPPDGSPTVRAAEGLDVQLFGEAAVAVEFR